MEQVILVDELDRELGYMEKMEVHVKGSLHRAFSVFIFNAQNQLLLQKRSLEKYHSAGLWSNTCCGHPRPHEETSKAALRRLYEEMGFQCPLQEKLNFIYNTTLTNGLIENELDHVYIGIFDGEPNMNHNEASDWKYMDWHDVINDVKNFPDTYTYWFKICLDKLEPYMIE